MTANPAGDGYELCSADLRQEQLGQPADAEADTPEPYDPEHLNEVISTFIEAKGGKVFIREMIYALTLRQKVPKDVYNDVRKVIRDSGIVRVKHGRFSLRNKGAPQEDDSSSSREPEDLEAKMRGAFSTSYHSTPPRKRRRKQN